MALRRKPQTEESFGVRELFDEWDKLLQAVAIAAGRAAEWPEKDVAEQLKRSTRSLYIYREKWGPAIAELERVLAPFVKMKRREIKEIAVDMAQGELEKILPNAFAAIKDAIDNGDLSVASDNGWKVINQLLGKAPQTLNVNSKGSVSVAHTHFHVMPADTLRAFESDALRDQKLLERAASLEVGNTPVTGARSVVIDVPSN